jgi:hypothetical protein
MTILFGLVFVVLGEALAVIVGAVLYTEKDTTKAPEAVTRIGKPIKA